MLNVVEVFVGKVKGRSCNVVLFGKIKVGILLLSIKGDIEGDIVGGKGSNFFFEWLWRGDEGGEGNFVVIFLLVKVVFVLIFGLVVGKDDDSVVWVCCCEIDILVGEWWGFFCCW